VNHRDSRADVKTRRCKEGSQVTAVPDAHHLQPHLS